MNISYSIGNIKCNGDSDGSITITSIVLTESEVATYGPSPVLDWTDNINPSSISADTKFINNLSGDIYGYRLYGNSTYSPFQYITLSEPDELEIVKITKTNNPCLSSASLAIEITGGTPPYVCSYGQYLSTGSGTVVISGISVESTNFIRVTDSNNCQILSDSDVFIDFSSTTFELLSFLPPKIYDDHPEEYIINISGDGPFKIVIWESENNTKTNILDQLEPYDTSNLLSISENSYKYNIANKVYPGNYILEIIDSNNCLLQTNTINVPNILPLSVNSTIKNDNQIDITAYLLLEPILDTILVPYQLIQQDSNILNFIKNFSLDDRVEIKIGSRLYNQRITKINRDRSNYFSNNIDIIHCGPEESEWFFNFYISDGFNISEVPEVFTENIVLIINNIEYEIVPEYNNDVSSIKLIRGSFLTKDINVSQFKINNTINLGSLSLPSYQLTKLSSVVSNQQVFLYNTYSIGSVFNVMFLENDKYNSVLNITTSNTVNFSSDSLQAILNLKQTLEFLNDFDNNLYIFTGSNLIHTGFIGSVVTGGVTANNTYNFSYKYWNSETKTLQNIYVNNKLASDSSVSDLKSGSYIVKISDDNNNKIKTINTIPYDEHYSLALDYIMNVLNTSPENLSFVYGDLLLNVAIYEETIQNTTSEVLGSSETTTTTIVQPLTTQVDTIETINISNNSSYNNYINIIMSNNVLCYLNGPNNYSYSFRKSIKFVNLPPGVYNIVGDTNELTNNFFEPISYIIYMSNNAQQNVYINFSSYSNQFIIGN